MKEEGKPNKRIKRINSDWLEMCASTPEVKTLTKNPKRQ